MTPSRIDRRKPALKDPLRQQLLALLRDDVITGRYPPGSRLVERDIASEFEVSRLPVREALQLLLAEGFVEPTPTRGLVVRTWSARDVRELFDIREALETMACREATSFRTDADLDALQAAVDDARAAVASGSVDAAHDANAAFHELLITASHNVTLETVMRPILWRVQWLVRQIPDPGSVSHDHQEIVDAIAERDAERAERLARKHADENRSLTLNSLFGDQP